MRFIRVFRSGVERVRWGRLFPAHTWGAIALGRILGATAVVAAMMAAMIFTGAPGGAAVPAPKDASLTGRLLVATLDLTDPRFVQSVIFMVDHDATGAMGLVINRPIGRIAIAALLEQLGEDGRGVGGELRVHYGGPVEPMQGFMLHTAEYAGVDTRVVGGGIALTTDPKVLRAIGAGSGPRRSLLALGYAGWAPGQLEAEIRSGHWVDVEADEKILFEEPADTQWERAMARRVIVL
jgi:putative transcriptional regulator